MTDGAADRRTPDGGASAQSEADRDAEARRRRRAKVFGDVLPESTGDDRDPDRRSGEGSGDEWFRRNVPPHHG